jgi:hypothetical protein
MCLCSTNFLFFAVSAWTFSVTAEERRSENLVARLSALANAAWVQQSEGTLNREVLRTSVLFGPSMLSSVVNSQGLCVHIRVHD